MSPSLTVTLPDLLGLANWPFPVKMNPYYEQVEAETKAWVKSFHILDSSRNLRKASKGLKGTFLIAMAFPSVSKEHLRLASDLNEWYFIFDETTDILDPADTRRLVQIAIATLRDPYQTFPKDHPPLAYLIKELWIRFLRFSVPSSVERLRKSLIEFIEATYIEAVDRSKLYVRGIDAYMDLRRRTAATAAIIYTHALKVDIPEEVMNHPRVSKLTLDGMTLLAIQNDVVSYKAERAAGLHGHNLITTAMREKSFDIQEAFDYCGQMFTQTAKEFLENLQTIPDLFSPEINEALSHHTLGIAQWVSALVEWSFSSERYFGKESKNIQRHGIIELGPEPKGREYQIQDLLRGQAKK